MARVIVTLQLMPESPDVPLTEIETKALEEIKKFAGPGETKKEQEPIAFGLVAVKITFVMDEELGSTEPLEIALGKINGVASVTVTDVRRAIG